MNKYLFNTPITVYTFARSPITGLDTRIRTFVPKASWTENSVQIQNKTGVLVASNINVTVMKEKPGELPMQISQQQWTELYNLTDNREELGKYYAFLAAVTPAPYTVVFKGNNPFEFGYYQQTGANTLAVATNAFLNANPGARTLSAINYNWVGRMKYWHITAK